MNGLNQSDEFGILAGQIDTNGNSQSYVMDGTRGASTVPEPGTIALVGCGLALAGLRRRFK